MRACRLADALIDVQAQQRDENVAALARGVRLEKPVELALRQHDDAREHIEVHAQQLLFDVVVGVFLLQQLIELSAVLEDLHVLAGRGALADDAIFGSAQVKGQGDVKLLCAVADDVLTLAVLRSNARNPAIEGITDRVYNGRLAGAGLALNGEQRQVAEIDRDRVAVGHEVLDLKRLYPHLSLPDRAR